MRGFTKTNMDTLTALSVVALAALIHASFQLGVSIITALSSYAEQDAAASNRRVFGRCYDDDIANRIARRLYRKRLLPQRINTASVDDYCHSTRKHRRVCMVIILPPRRRHELMDSARFFAVFTAAHSSSLTGYRSV